MNEGSTDSIDKAAAAAGLRSNHGRLFLLLLPPSPPAAPLPWPRARVCRFVACSLPVQGCRSPHAGWIPLVEKSPGRHRRPATRPGRPDPHLSRRRRFDHAASYFERWRGLGAPSTRHTRVSSRIARRRQECNGRRFILHAELEASWHGIHSNATTVWTIHVPKSSMAASTRDGMFRLAAWMMLVHRSKSTSKPAAHGRSDEMTTMHACPMPPQSIRQQRQASSRPWPSVSW